MASVLVADADQPRESTSSSGSALQPPIDRPVVDVAVGILLRPNGEFLLTSRPPGKVYAGYWEFPGGKVEAGETVAEALRRELREEIGVEIGLEVGAVQLWREQLVDYPHALVRLHFCRVYHWQGELQMHEGQTFAWQHLPVKVSPVLPGTLPVLAWMQEEMDGRPG